PADKLLPQELPGHVQISVEDGAWKIVAREKRLTPLFHIPTTDIKKGTLTFRAKMKSTNLPKNAYLRLDVHLGKEEVVRSDSKPISGVSDWAAFEWSCGMDENHSPEAVKLKVVFDSRGTVWIKDVELVYVPAPGVAAAVGKPVPPQVLDELRGIVRAREQSLKIAQDRYKGGVSAVGEVHTADVDLIEARIKLAVAERTATVQLLENLVRRRQEQLEQAELQFKLRVVTQEAVLAAKQKVSEARIRLATARAEEPEVAPPVDANKPRPPPRVKRAGK